MEKVKRSNCVVFPLVLTGKWYKMIASGEKTEEYRDVTPRYNARFKNFRIKCRDRGANIHGHGYRISYMLAWRRVPDAVVAFSLGYTKPDMFFTIQFSIARCWPPVEATAENGDYWSPAIVRESSCHPEWGEPSYPHYVIKLAERVELC